MIAAPMMSGRNRLDGGATMAPGSVTRTHTLDRLVAFTTRAQGVRGRDVSVGDWLVVRTKNSVYVLSTQADGRFIVTGGWFSTHGVDATSVGVSGCTWGRYAILTGMVAAPGMCIEFDNGVRTTRVRDVQLIRRGAPSVH
jgi:hypothetical protein